MKASVADYETLVGDVGDLRAFALACDLKSLTAAARAAGEGGYVDERTKRAGTASASHTLSLPA